MPELRARHLLWAWRFVTKPKPRWQVKAERALGDARDVAELVNMTLPDADPKDP